MNYLGDILIILIMILCLLSASWDSYYHLTYLQCVEFARVGWIVGFLMGLLALSSRFT